MLTPFLCSGGNPDSVPRQGATPAGPTTLAEKRYGTAGIAALRASVVLIVAAQNGMSASTAPRLVGSLNLTAGAVIALRNWARAML